eukprot:scaffold182858_cov36-Tisochrysis_lutea.AAC.2
MSADCALIDGRVAIGLRGRLDGASSPLRPGSCVSYGSSSTLRVVRAPLDDLCSSHRLAPTYEVKEDCVSGKSITTPSQGGGTACTPYIDVAAAAERVSLNSRVGSRLVRLHRLARHQYQKWRP